MTELSEMPGKARAWGPRHISERAQGWPRLPRNPIRHSKDNPPISPQHQHCLHDGQSHRSKLQV